MTFKSREIRLSNLLANADEIHPLLRGSKISDIQLSNLQGAVIYYTYTSLIHCFGHEFKLCSDLMDRYANYISKLPNITPNGLMLPKQENFLVYHEIHRAVVDVLDAHAEIKLIHNPINIRLVQGKSSPEVANRPKASTKLHTDIWAGEFSNSMMIFLPLFGDIENIGVEFFEPPEDFYPDWIKPLDDYSEGAHLLSQSKRYDCNLKNGYIYFVDPFLLHRTFKKSNEWRLSLDFRFIPKEDVDTDLKINTKRDENYIEYEEWREIGRTRLLFTDTPIDKYDSHCKDNVYASKYETISLI